MDGGTIMIETPNLELVEEILKILSGFSGRFSMVEQGSEKPRVEIDLIVFAAQG